MPKVMLYPGNSAPIVFGETGDVVVSQGQVSFWTAKGVVPERRFASTLPFLVEYGEDDVVFDVPVQEFFESMPDPDEEEGEGPELVERDEM